MKSSYFIIIIALLLIFYILLPYLDMLFLAYIFSYFIYPINNRLGKKIGYFWSSILITSFFFVLFLLVSSLIINQILLNIPSFFNFLTSQLSYLKSNPELYNIASEFAKNLSKILIERGTKFLFAIPNLVLKGIVFFTFLFYFIKDFDSFHSYLKDLIPKKDLIVKIQNIIEAIVYGKIFTAFIQSLLAYIFYFLLGVPYSLIFALITFLISIIPFLGPFMVYIPLSFYLIFIGEIYKGIILLGLGLGILSTIDNFLLPKFAAQKYKIHPSLFFIGIISGIYLFGFMGFIYGPIILLVSKEILEEFIKEQF